MFGGWKTLYSWQSFWMLTRAGQWFPVYRLGFTRKHWLGAGPDNGE
jgi:hypothetical protein